MRETGTYRLADNIGIGKLNAKIYTGQQTKYRQTKPPMDTNRQTKNTSRPLSVNANRRLRLLEAITNAVKRA